MAAIALISIAKRYSRSVAFRSQRSRRSEIAVNTIIAKPCREHQVGKIPLCRPAEGAQRIADAGLKLSALPFGTALTGFALNQNIAMCVKCRERQHEAHELVSKLGSRRADARRPQCVQGDLSG